jgi:hypothetical protein
MAAGERVHTLTYSARVWRQSFISCAGLAPLRCFSRAGLAPPRATVGVCQTKACRASLARAATPHGALSISGPYLAVAHTYVLHHAYELSRGTR